MFLEKNKRIGVWGFGVAGKAIVEYFLKQGNTVSVMDKRELQREELHENQKKTNSFL